MARRLAIGVLLAAALAGSAVASATDPEKRHTASDQAWAKAIGIHRADLPGGGWIAQRTSGESGYAPSGCTDPNLSDLVETGGVEGPGFMRGGSLLGSDASIFRSERDATAAWSRTSKVPIARCLVSSLRAGLIGSNASVRVTSTTRVRRGLAPHETGRRIAFRVSASTGARIDGRMGYYLFARGRAFADVVVISIGRPAQPIAVSVEDHLAAAVAARLRR